MSTTYINEETFGFVAETLVALENAYAERAKLARDDAEFFWATQSIQEMHADLTSLERFDEAHEGV